MKNPFGISIRKCKKSDYAFVHDLSRKTVFPYMAMTTKINKALFDKDFYGNYKNTKILTKGKRRIGFYCIKFHKQHLQMKKLYLSQAYQKKGIGTFMMKHFETLGKNLIRLEVWVTNPAKKFYEKLGYNVTGQNGDLYVMEKRISN